MHGFSWPMTCGIFLDQGSNPCPLHWQADFNHWNTREVWSSFHMLIGQFKVPLLCYVSLSFVHCPTEFLRSYLYILDINSLSSTCIVAAAAAKSLQLCPTLCDPIDGSPPGSSVPGILQARTLEWVAISFSNAWKWKVKGKSHSRVWLLATPWTTAHQAPPSMGFSRQEYWSGVPLPSPTCIVNSL